MNRGMNFLGVLFVLAILASCSKNDVSEENASCYVCSTEAESIDVCAEGSDFVVGGERIDNPNHASLEEFILAIEANPDNDPALEGIRCRRK